MDGGIRYAFYTYTYAPSVLATGGRYAKYTLLASGPYAAHECPRCRPSGPMTPMFCARRLAEVQALTTHQSTSRRRSDQGDKQPGTSLTERPGT